MTDPESITESTSDDEDTKDKQTCCKQTDCKDIAPFLLHRIARDKNVAAAMVSDIDKINTVRCVLGGRPDFNHICYHHIRLLANHRGLQEMRTLGSTIPAASPP